MAATESGDADLLEPMEFQEEELASSTSNVSDAKFDATIGHIEDIIMEDHFQKLQTEFMDKHYHHFDDDEENKFIYTDIFKEYMSVIEKYIETQLTERIPEFTMEWFSKQLEKRKKDEDGLNGEIFEILYTFSDFVAFKEMFLDYKADKEGRSLDFSDGFIVTPLQVASSPPISAPSTSLNQTGQS